MQDRPLTYQQFGDYRVWHFPELTGMLEQISETPNRQQEAETKVGQLCMSFIWTPHRLQKKRRPLGLGPCNTSRAMIRKQS